MAGTGGVKNAIGEPESDQAPGRMGIAMQRMHLVRHEMGEARLLLDEPACDPAGAASAALAARDFEGAGFVPKNLCERGGSGGEPQRERQT